MKTNWTIIGILLGLGVGIGGGLFYAWVINPVARPNVQPWQLDQSGQRAWIIAASVGWARDNNLLAAADRLNERPSSASRILPVTSRVASMHRPIPACWRYGAWSNWRRVRASATVPPT
jgi:hypothetical protein